MILNFGAILLKSRVLYHCAVGDCFSSFDQFQCDVLNLHWSLFFHFLLFLSLPIVLILFFIITDYPRHQISRDSILSSDLFLRMMLFHIAVYNLIDFIRCEFGKLPLLELSSNAGHLSVSQTQLLFKETINVMMSGRILDNLFSILIARSNDFYGLIVLSIIN